MIIMMTGNRMYGKWDSKAGTKIELET